MTTETSGLSAPAVCMAHLTGLESRVHVVPHRQARLSVAGLPELIGQPRVRHIVERAPPSGCLLAERTGASECELPLASVHMRPIGLFPIVRRHPEPAANPRASGGEFVQRDVRAEAPLDDLTHAERVDEELTVIVLRDQLEAAVAQLAQR